MNAWSAAPITTSLFAAAALLVAVAPPPVAAHNTTQSVVAKAPPLMNKDCHKAFRKDLKDLRKQSAAIWDYHEAHFLSESTIYDGMRVLLADPNTPPEGIAQQQSAASQFLAVTQPLVTKERKKAYKALNAFEARFLDKDTGCLRRNGARVFKAGVRDWRSALESIYRAHEHLFAMNKSVAALKIDEAYEWMQADVQEMASVDKSVEKAEKQFDKLLGR